MNDTKEKIMTEALRLFAAEGYEAVPVSRIAAALGMTKGALYKHYRSKRDIFDSILRRMEQNDADNAQKYALPVEQRQPADDCYRSTTEAEIAAFSVAQFRYWTEEEFACCFRRMLTLEQYRSPEMGALYRQYLAGGPVDYLTDLLQEKAGGEEAARQQALRFYGPIFLGYSLYDAAEDRGAVLEEVRRHIEEYLGGGAAAERSKAP